MQTLDLERLSQALDTCEIGHTVSYYETIETTMRVAHALANEPSTHSGTIVVTEEQTAGKGRRGRQWAAPYGTALLFSVLLKPPDVSLRPACVPMAAGVAVLEALSGIVTGSGLSVKLKWPNDVLVESTNAVGKIAGILSEASYYGNELSYVVVGIGINVNQTTAELPVVDHHMIQPVSLRSTLNRTADRTELLIQTCRRLAHYFRASSGEDSILTEWKGHLATLGKQVDVYSGKISTPTVFTGIATDVTSDGDLIVRNSTGIVRTFTAADVSVRESYE